MGLLQRLTNALLDTGLEPAQVPLDASPERMQELLKELSFEKFALRDEMAGKADHPQVAETLALLSLYRDDVAAFRAVVKSGASDAWLKSVLQHAMIGIAATIEDEGSMQP